MTESIRVRFAPSPTGHLHIGGARSALFNYLLARKMNGTFIIRVEDTDRTRNVDNAEAKFFESLKWLGLEWNESVDVGGAFAPYRSMDRLDIYKDYLDQLLESGQAYHCYCTSDELEKQREAYMSKGETPRYSGACRHLTPEQKEAFEAEGRVPSIRFKVPANKILKVNDLVRGEVDFESDGIGDFVIARPDGIPTYNFAVTIDDHLMEISHVIRGEEHLSNTPRQLLIYDAFSWKHPQFAHVSLILNQDRQKMSKRDESIIQFVEQYKELGFLPEAIVNFIALLGWSPEGEQEILSMDELISQFTLQRVAKSPAVFDIQKLYWMNNHYIKNTPIETLVSMCIPHLRNAGYIADELSVEQMEWLTVLVGLYQEQLNYAAEISELSKVIFETEINYDQEALAILNEDHIPVVMESFSNQLKALEDYKPDAIKTALKTVQKETGYKGKQLFMPVRVAATGQTHGRDLPETLYLLGKEKVLNRVNAILTKDTVQ